MYTMMKLRSLWTFSLLFCGFAFSTRGQEVLRLQATSPLPVNSLNIVSGSAEMAGMGSITGSRGALSGLRTEVRKLDRTPAVSPSDNRLWQFSVVVTNIGERSLLIPVIQMSTDVAIQKCSNQFNDLDLTFSVGDGSGVSGPSTRALVAYGCLALAGSMITLKPREWIVLEGRLEPLEQPLVSPIVYAAVGLNTQTFAAVPGGWKCMTKGLVYSLSDGVQRPR